MSFVRIGQIVGAHGLKGQVKVEPGTDFLERFEVGSRLRLKGDWVTVEQFSIHKDRPLLKLSGIKDVEAAKALQWEYLEAAPLTDQDLPEDDFLVEDLIGLKAVSLSGEPLGEVEDVMTYPAQDILVIGETLVPLVKEFVKEVDLERGVIVIELLDGMQDANS